ncbi:MAG: FecR domain-containing protein [Candidatus Riflebacteria bacterium]|nr:FecR domain-containing protein [Candidatus Riflebacteria bacterium]
MAKQWHQLERLDHKSLKKLQVEREKNVLNQKSDSEKKRVLVIVGAVLFVLLAIAGFVTVIMNRAAKKEFQERREELYKSTVIDARGTTLGRSIGEWEKIKKGTVINGDYSFKTEKDGFLVVELQLKNQVKLASVSEMTVFKPELDDKENKVNKERVSVNRGEVTVAVSPDGRELLEVEANRVVALGASGLYKMLYNVNKGTGEVVVKNGLVEVFSRSGEAGGFNGKRVKVSGFYKVTFQNGQISNPTQASIIQYDWR